MGIFTVFFLINLSSFAFYRHDMKNPRGDFDPGNRLADMAAMFGSLGALLAVVTAKPSERRSLHTDTVIIALLLQGIFAAIIVAVYFWPSQ